MYELLQRTHKHIQTPLNINPLAYFILTFQILAVLYLPPGLRVKFYMVLALRSVFCVDLRRDSGLCCIRH